MKKIFGISALAAFCLTLFSFSTIEGRKANYNEVNHVNFKTVNEAAKFSQYQRSQYTTGEGTWSYRRETWSLTAEKANMDQLEKVINK
jgi:hypothetical protein